MSECEEITTAVILAGGRNLRFPKLKGFINFEGTPIIARNLALLDEFFDEVFLSVNDPGPYFTLVGRTGARLIGDVLPSMGPMSGIHSALLNTKGPGVFVTACDMPFLKKETIAFICEQYLRRCREYGPCDAAAAVFNNRPQPLLGIYSRTLLPRIEDAVRQGKTAMVPFLSEVRTCFIDEPDMRAVDPEGRSFMNINTVEDYEHVKHMLDRKA